MRALRATGWRVGAVVLALCAGGCGTATLRLRDLEPVGRDPDAVAPRLDPAVYRMQPAAAARTYVVRRGDTLFRISAAVYGDGHKWRRIYEANRHALRSPDDLRIGMKLVIP